MHFGPLVVARLLRWFSVRGKIVLALGRGHFLLTLDSRHEDRLGKLAIDPLSWIYCLLVATCWWGFRSGLGRTVEWPSHALYLELETDSLTAWDSPRNYFLIMCCTAAFLARLISWLSWPPSRCICSLSLSTNYAPLITTHILTALYHLRWQVGRCHRFFIYVFLSVFKNAVLFTLLSPERIHHHAWLAPCYLCHILGLRS